MQTPKLVELKSGQRVMCQIETQSFEKQWRESGSRYLGMFPLIFDSLEIISSQLDCQYYMVSLPTRRAEILRN